MSLVNTKVEVHKIESKEDMNPSKKIIEGVYVKEKKWIKSVRHQMNENELFGNSNISWFIARVNGAPAGLLRLFYDSPLDFPDEYEISIKEGIDLMELESKGRFVEISRFMILPVYRRNLRVSLELMRTAIKEVVSKGYSHFITNVFKGEKHSPYRFHAKLFGFQVIGTHVHGELNCNCTRIIMILDILSAYVRIRNKKNRFYEILLHGMRDLFESKLLKKYDVVS
ncbi:MAG: hypothetical protein JXJ04_04555 [Spirochaetales bacterium]|nr:hypothetical protein [Spirochaetales bacterium]